MPLQKILTFNLGDTLKTLPENAHIDRKLFVVLDEQTERDGTVMLCCNDIIDDVRVDTHRVEASNSSFGMTDRNWANIRP